MEKIRNGKNYLSEHLTANDYYCQHESVSGTWVGALASEWGLTGPIQAGDQAFENLRLGKTPSGSEPLTQRGGGIVRFYDFQCSAQKSVSLMAVTLDDQRLRETHQRLSREALEGALQQFACRRVRAGAKAWTQDTESTGKFLAAAFVHDASRALDCQLHTHFVVGNVTTGRDGKRYALETSEMLKAIRYAGKTYQNSMARAVRELGYQIVEKKDYKGNITGFEIAGIPEKILTRFSKRRGEVQAAIGRFILETGRDPSPREIHTLTLQSRGKDRAKLQEISTAEVLAYQLNQLSKEERASLEAIRDAAKGATAPLPPILREDCDQAVEWSLAHLTERQSVITRHELEAEALNSALGYVDAQGISEATERFMAKCTLVSLTDNGLQSLLSTHEVLAMEQESIAAIDRGRWGFKPVATFIKSPDLSKEQNEAVRTLTENCSRHAILRGVAGSGKTTTLKHFNDCLTTCSKKPIYLAPTAAAVKVLKKELGCDAMTVSAYLESLKGEGRKRFKGVVLAVDEAGLLSLSQGHEILKQAEQLGQKVTFIGDTAQMRSVSQGDFLRLLETHSKIKKTQITDIRRQKKAAYRSAVMTMAAGSGGAKEGLEQLETMGWVESAGASYISRAADLWLEQSKMGTSTEDCILVCPTHAEGHAVTEKIRSHLRTQGRLGHESVTTVSDSLSWTAAQRRRVQNFQPGMLLTGTRDSTSLKSGETASVVTITDGRIILSNGSTLDPRRSGAVFDVGTSRQLTVAAGDLIQIRQNLKSHQLTNGEVLQIESITADGFRTSCGKLIPKEFAKIQHGYAVTCFAAQGRTAKTVVIAAQRLDAKSCYVGVSRGRERCTVVTPDAAVLKSHLADGNRHSAHDVIAQRHSSIRKSDNKLAQRRRTLHAWAERVMRFSAKNSENVMRAGKRFLRTAMGKSIVQSRRKGFIEHHPASIPLPIIRTSNTSSQLARGGRGGR